MAQLYWPQIPRNLNYQEEQITDQEALRILYDEMPALEEKRTTDLKTYTWFLNKPENAVNDFPELKDYSEGQTFSGDYLHPSTEPLQTDGFTYEWSREEHESTHKDFTFTSSHLLNNELSKRYAYLACCPRRGLRAR